MRLQGVPIQDGVMPYGTTDHLAGSYSSAARCESGRRGLALRAPRDELGGPCTQLTAAAVDVLTS